MSEENQLAKDHERLRLECIATLTDVGIAMLVGSDPTATGEVPAAIRRLASERDRLRVVAKALVAWDKGCDNASVSDAMLSMALSLVVEAAETALAQTTEGGGK